MRRVLAVVVSGAMLVALGCGSYDKRMNDTLVARRYAKQLDDNLEPAPKDGPLKERNVYIRPPKPLEAAKESNLAVPEGQFDAVRTFYEGTKTSLHVLVREKQATKKAATKGAPAEPPVARNPFNAEVLNVLKGVYGDDENLAIEKFKDDPQKGGNTFKRVIFTANGKDVQVYLYKLDPYEVALIFQADPGEKAQLSSKVKLCLESFAVGNKARTKYSNGGSEEEAAEAAGPAVVF